MKPPEFSRPITDVQLRYAVRDPLTTAQCYFELRRRYVALELPTRLDRVYSEASVAKGYLDKMSIIPWRQVQPKVDSTIIGYLMSTYVAGRTDTKIRREIRRVAICDFTALYPTGCVLLGLWKFIISDGFRCSEGTEDLQVFLNWVSLDDLQRPQTWPKMVGIAQVRANEDVLPIRGQYGRRPGRRIGWNHFSQHEDDHLIWVTVLDLVASKILTGRVPKIVRGLSFSPLEPQKGLQTITFGDGYKFNPYVDDLFKVVNEQRIAVNKQLLIAKETGDSELVDRLDGMQRHLKTVANAIYGFFEEQNIEERKRAVEHVVYSIRGQEPKHRWLKSIEKPGKFFQPLLGTCITASAHLFLAISEHLAQHEGIEWMFCDTDSMAFVRPADMDDVMFLAKVESIRGWFAPLNPYNGLPNDDLFKSEKVNVEPDGETPRELLGLAIAPKSYCLFTLDESGAPIIQEGKQHGLGHLLPPYVRSDKEERVCLELTKLRCWQRDVWALIVRAHLEGHPDIVDYSSLENFDLPAAHRFTVSTIKTENDCKHFNRGRPYRERMRPGNFLISFPTKNPARLQDGIGVPLTPSPIGRTRDVSPYAPYDRDIPKAAAACFDRKTGKPIPINELKTYAEALRYYHIRPQDKMRGARYLDLGTTRRRHLMPLRFDTWERKFGASRPRIRMSLIGSLHLYGIWFIPSLTYIRYASNVLGIRVDRKGPIQISNAQTLDASRRTIAAK